MTVPKVLVTLIFALSAFWGTSSFASDGALEINQACAVNGGCFAGDEAGFPVTITQPGSYRLTGNLDLTDQAPSVPAVIVSAPAVSLDLGGFQLRGPTNCTGSGASLACAPGDPAGFGIEIQETAPSVSVRNGTVRGFASQGLASAGIGARISDVTAFHNREDGIAFEEYGIVTNSVAFENLGDGFDVDAGSVVDGVTAFGNHLDGIEVDGPKAVVTRSTSSHNGAKGFNLAPGSKYIANTSQGNVVEDTCGGGICSEQRRFYLTLNEAFDGVGAPNACADGFHFASTYEIRDTTMLAYDSVLGYTLDDSGSGPPTPLAPSNPYGWIRTGSSGNFETNCDAYTVNVGGATGTVIILTSADFHDEPAGRISPFSSLQRFCDLPQRVWCIED